MRTEDGRRTRSGRIVRSDNVRRLTDAGCRALADHGVPFFDKLIFGGEERRPRSHSVDGAGQALVDALHRACVDASVDIALGQRVDRLVVENGAANLRLTDVAERADVAFGSLYTYFENKDAILDAVVAATLGELIAAARPDAEEYDDDRESVLARASEAGITGIMVPGYTPAEWSRLAPLAQRDARVIVAVAG